jgi:hypothetical protein
VAGPRTWRASELLRQIDLTRAQPGATGNVHFSMRAFMRNPDSLNDQLLAGPYAEQALVPASPWLDSLPPAPPRLYLTMDRRSRERRLELRPGSETELPRQWRVSLRRGRQWETVIIPGQTFSLPLSRAGGRARVAELWVTAVDRAGNESAPATMRLP